MNTRLLIATTLFFSACDSSPAEQPSVGHDPDAADASAQAPDPAQPADAPEAGDSDSEGSDAEGSDTADSAGSESDDSEGASAPVTMDGEVAKVTLIVQNALAYSHDLIRIPAGAKTIELTLEHQGNIPATALGHNVVILKQGTDGQAYAAAAISAQADGYIPKDKADDVIAHTKLLGGGEKDTITFDVPAAGTYEYLCSFPGHYALMNGKLIVES